MNLSLKILISSLMMTALTSFAQAAPLPILGTWTNSTSNGVVRVVIAEAPGGYKMRVWGACSPSPCDYGWTSIWTYGKNSSDAKHKAAIGHYSFSFKNVEVIAKLQSHNRLIVEDFNYFTDASGRQNYWKSKIFKRVTMAAEPGTEEPPANTAEPVE